MAKVQLQFHVAPAEALTLAGEWARKRDLTVAVERFFPTYRASVVGDGMPRAGDEEDRIDRVALCRGTPDVTASSAHEFATQNRRCLFLTIGELEDDGLRQSSLGAVTDDDEDLRTWRSVVREAKAPMHRGAVLRDPDGEVARHLPHHLHTVGAHDLAQQGVAMLPVAGWNRLQFDDCRPEG